LQEILNSGNAVLLPPEDLPAWIGALCSLRENETLGARLAGQARQDVENYTWEGRVRGIMQDL
jgi:glycosyltransferase involved in cell wall biosynthesis